MTALTIAFAKNSLYADMSPGHPVLASTCSGPCLLQPTALPAELCAATRIERALNV